MHVHATLRMYCIHHHYFCGEATLYHLQIPMRMRRNIMSRDDSTTEQDGECCIGRYTDSFRGSICSLCVSNLPTILSSATHP